jgi:hypothetical protein
MAMTQTTMRPKFNKASPEWGYVARGLYNGLRFVPGDYGYPAPEWSDGKMRVRLDYNDYNQRVWVAEAHRRGVEA